MGNLRAFSGELLRDEGGQALFEYVLVLAICVSAITIMGMGFRKGVAALWISMLKQVAPACPGCTPPPALQ